jgi:hypothetical protein
MSHDEERALRQAARMNRERLAVAHREAVIDEEAKRAADIRQNMARLKELRLANEAQEARTEISKANQSAGSNPKKRPLSVQVRLLRAQGNDGLSVKAAARQL